MAFDQFTLAELAALEQFPLFLGVEVDAALFEGAKIFAQAAIDNTWAGFKNPTGVLASDIVAIMEGHFQSAVTSGVPYNWRREEGFSGMTDSLGRFYPYDPGILYMHNAFDAKEMDVFHLVELATARALGRATLSG